MAISRSEPRKLVVWEMTLIKARSVSRNARLRIRAGRIFWAIPKSTSQTSPRLGTVLLFVQKSEALGGDRSQVVVRQWAIIRRCYLAGNRLIYGQLIEARQSAKLINDRFGFAAHRPKIIRF